MIPIIYLYLLASQKPKTDLKKLVPLFFIFGLNAFLGNCQETGFFNDKTQKLVELDSLLLQTFSSNPEAFIDYSIQYIELAHELDSIEEAARKAMNVQRPLTIYANDPKKAITIINSVLIRKYKIKDSLLLGGLYLKRGRAMAKVNLEKAIEDYTVAIKNFSEKDTLNIADAHLFRGQAYSSTGKFVEASENFTKAYILYESKKAYAYMVYAQQGIINMFSMNGFYDKAKKERENLINKMRLLNLDTYLAGEYFNQAIDYRKMGKRRLEYESLLEAEKLYDENPSNTSTFIGIHSMLIGYYCDFEQFDKAKIHLDFLEALDYNFAGDTASEINYLGGKAEYLKANGELSLALKLAQKKLELAQQLGIEDEIMGSYDLLSEIYLSVGEPYKSIESAKAASAIRNSIYNIYTTTKINFSSFIFNNIDIYRKVKVIVMGII